MAKSWNIQEEQQQEKKSGLAYRAFVKAKNSCMSGYAFINTID